MRVSLRISLLAVPCAAALAIVAIASSPASWAVANSGSHDRDCRVGEPTTWKTTRFGFKRGEVSVKFFSPVLVLSCGRTGFLRAGALEIVGYETAEGLCASAQVKKQMLFGGICEPSGTSWQDSTSKPIFWFGAGWGGGGPEPSSTNLAGDIAPNVAHVEVRFRRQGKVWTKAATVARVDGELLKKLRQTEPFGRFAALLPGCVPPQEINVVARGPKGEFIGSQRGRKSLLPDFCHPGALSK
jgi:hypothetical protein